MIALNRGAQLDEARLLLRWAAGDLNPTERMAVEAFARDISGVEAARRCGLSRGAMFMAQRTALPKMRRRLEAVGIHRVADVLS